MFILSAVPAFSASASFREEVLDLQFNVPRGDFVKYPVTGAQKESIIYQGLMRDYYYLLPEKYDENTPVVIVLHGSDRTGLSMIDTWSCMLRSFPAILIAPSGYGGSWAPAHGDKEFIAAVLDAIVQKYKLKTRTPYLFGHSNGGIYALMLAAECPERYPVVAVHAVAVPEWVKLAKKSREKYAGSRSAIFLGNADEIFSLEQARRTAEKLSSFGLETTLFILPGHNHWYYDDNEEINTFIVTFFKKGADAVLRGGT